MSHGNHTCGNPDCNSSYTINHNDADDGFCSFQCWEKVNCGKPEKNTETLNLQDILVAS